ncbi:hypothetical protein Pan241w_50740 [Gimesia alba]|uniref:Uncharacterized protein n=1 Tax=Gimesia alba TaxID=2527973 RepID=A0A517RM47_9PLAN|nr:hypothetical protein [Gimesia alba]QDT44957.1 hypothetical protein Pan241w_50740 [Gimesia alba]
MDDHAPTICGPAVSGADPRLGEIQLLNRALQQATSELNGTKNLFEQVDVGLENAELGIVLVEVDGVIDGTLEPLQSLKELRASQAFAVGTRIAFERFDDESQDSRDPFQ